MTGDGLEAGLALLDDLGDAREGPAGAHARDQEIHGSVGVPPDLLGGGAPVDGRVRRVRELLEDDAVRDLGVEFLGLGDGAAHALRAFGQDEFGTEDLEELASFKAHRLRHGQHQLQTPRGGHEGQRDAGVPAGRFDQHGILVDAARGERVVNHGHADAVLDAGERVEELQLEQDVRDRAVGPRGALEPDERGVADGLGDVVEDAGHGSGDQMFCATAWR